MAYLHHRTIVKLLTSCCWVKTRAIVRVIDLEARTLRRLKCVEGIAVVT